MAWSSSTLSRFGRKAALHILVLMLWMATFLLAALLEYAPHASIWFPPAAITFSALMVLGTRILPVLWIACVAATFLINRIYEQGLGISELLMSGAAFAFAHTVAYGLVAIPLRHMAWDTTPVTTLRKVTYLLVGGALASGLAAVLGSWGLTLTGMIDPAEFLPLLAPWWIGDYAGLLTLGPMTAVVLAKLAGLVGVNVPPGVQQFTKSLPLTARFAWKLAVLVGVSVLILTATALFPAIESLVFLLFFTVVIQMWIVHTEPEIGALLGIVLVSLAVVVATWIFGLGDQALILQFVLITLAVNSYFGLAVPSLYNDNRRLRYLLMHDSLTGALSRAFFEDDARLGIESARKRHEPAVLIMVDLDHLKAINDQHGHAAGDLALKSLADCCQSVLLPGELLGRLSGDEFAVFLPGCGLDEAERKVSRIRAALEIHRSSHRAAVKASFGIAELDADAPTYEAMLAKADAAMYREKFSDW
jgi:diguanylate cyclase (GGDEF)-like protein